MRVGDLEANGLEQGLTAFGAVRGIDIRNFSFLCCAPHTFHRLRNRGDIAKAARPLLAHIDVADSVDHRASSGLTYILDSVGPDARVHQHPAINERDVEWPAFFEALARTRFDGTLTACAFASEDRDAESSRVMVAGVLQMAQATETAINLEPPPVDD